MTPSSSGSAHMCQVPMREGRSPEVLRAADVELARGRHAAALALVDRALARGPASSDLAVRLRLARGHALWLCGRTRAGATEVAKVDAECREPLTRARSLELLGLFDWKSQELDRAGARLAEAQALWEKAPRARGAARALCWRAGQLRDSGRLVSALNLLADAVVAALASGRDDVLAEAHAGRAALLAAPRRASLVGRGGEPRVIDEWVGLGP